jgi:hypothetical protein
MMEIELGSGWIPHQHCKVDNVLALLCLKNVSWNLDFDCGAVYNSF